VTSSSDDRWRQLGILIDAALDRGPAERAGYLENECAGDLALRAEVEGIVAKGSKPSFLDSGALAFERELGERVR